MGCWRVRCFNTDKPIYAWLKSEIRGAQHQGWPAFSHTIQKAGFTFGSHLLLLAVWVPCLSQLTGVHATLQGVTLPNVTLPFRTSVPATQKDLSLLLRQEVQQACPSLLEARGKVCCTGVRWLLETNRTLGLNPATGWLGEHERSEMPVPSLCFEQWWWKGLSSHCTTASFSFLLVYLFSNTTLPCTGSWTHLWRAEQWRPRKELRVWL